MAVVLGVAVALGCGPRAARDPYPDRPCAESIQARAEGKYTGDDRDVWAPHLTYFDSCNELCAAGGGAPACVEAALLDNDNWHVQPRGGVTALVDWCEAGDPQACAWVASNQDQIDAHVQLWVEVEAQREDEAEQAEANRAQYESDAASLEGVLAAIIDELSAEGYALEFDHVVSLRDTGSAQVWFSIDASESYAFVLVAVRGTRFTATVGGGDFERLDSFDVVDVDPAVYAMTTRVQLGRDANAGKPVITISDDGGDSGDVHVMRFTRAR